MNVQECKGCGFKVMTDEPVVEPAGGWFCPLCADKANVAPNGVASEEPSLPADLLSPENPPPAVPRVAAAPPKGLMACPACGGVIKVVEEQFGRRVRCPLCSRPLSVSETGEVEEYDEFKEYLRERARENRESVGRGRQEATRERMGDSKEGEEERPPENMLATVALYVLLLVPFAAGSLAIVSPTAIRKVERILAKILPLLS